MEKLQLNKKQFRAVNGVADAKSVNAEDRTMEFSFSSEVPYERYYGFEIISHEKGAMNLDRLKSDAPLLFNHDMDQLIGVIEKAWIGDDRRGYVKVRFSASALGEEKLKQVQEGVLKNVSFGYMIDEMKLTKAGGNGSPDEYTVTKCTPYEVSMVTVPADYSVGVARSTEGEQITVAAEKGAECADCGGPMAEGEGCPACAKAAADKKLQDDLTASQKAAEKGRIMDDIQKAAAAAKQAEKERIASIDALGTKFGDTELARQLKEGDKSVDEARAAFIEKHVGKQKPVTGKEAEVGLTTKEIEKFSFVKALHLLANPNSKEAREAAAFELEVSHAAAQKGGKAARGLMIPVDVLRASKRDLVVGTASAGGNTVATDLLAGSFIDILRNKMVLQQAGIQVLNGLNGNIAIPRQTGAASAYWVAESGNPTESQPAFDQVTMSPKTVGAFTDYSRKLLLQSSIDVENFVRGDLAAVIALELDRAGLYGAGSSNEPQGLKLVSGINTKDFAAATPTFAEIVDLETKVASANADVGAMKYLVNASMRGALKVKEKASGYPVYVMGDDGKLNGYDALMSNQIASGDIFFGVWNQLIMGLWSGLDLMVDPYAGALAGSVRVIAHQDCDIAVRHPEAFTRGNDTL
jgi:HK97 family phage major capsid protein/HK97 family phage prohead protease